MERHARDTQQSLRYGPNNTERRGSFRSLACSAASICRPPAGQVEHPAGRRTSSRPYIATPPMTPPPRPCRSGPSGSSTSMYSHVLRRHLLEDVRLDHRRRDAVDEDARLASSLPSDLGVGDHAGLGGELVGGVGVALLAGDRRTLTMRPTVPATSAAGTTARQHRNTPVRSHVHDQPPRLRRQLPARLARAGDAGVVDQHVDRSGTFDVVEWRLRRQRPRPSRPRPPRGPRPCRAAPRRPSPRGCVPVPRAHFAPEAGSRSAMAYPMPCAAPVTMRRGRPGRAGSSDKFPVSRASSRYACRPGSTTKPIGRRRDRGEGRGGSDGISRNGGSSSVN